MFLEENNEHCKGVFIDCNTLQSLPAIGSIFKSLWSYYDSNNLDDGAANSRTINTFTNDSSLELGPTPSTTGSCLYKGNVYATESISWASPLHSEKTNQSKIIRTSNEELSIGKNLLSFPPQGE